MIRIVYLLLALCGVATICFALPAAHHWPHPRNLVASLLFVIGTLLMLTGTLLTFLPGFFHG